MDERPRSPGTSSATEQEIGLLRTFLFQNDIPCPQCGYNLRDLTTDICPECGERMQLGLSLVEPRQAAPIAGLVGLAGGAGFNGLLLIYGIIRGLRSILNDFITINLVGLLVVGALLTWWLWSWRRIRVRPAAQRWLLVIGCWIIVLADLAVFTIYIR